MNVIVFNRRTGAARQFDLTSPACALGLAGFLLLALSVAFVAGGFLGAEWAKGKPAAQVAAWSAALKSQQEELAVLRRNVEDKVDELAVRVGQMNADVLRLDALGRRLRSVAKINDADYGGLPPASLRNAAIRTAAVPPAPVAVRGIDAAIDTEIDRLGNEIAVRERELAALEAGLLSRDLKQSLLPQGAPVDDPTITSTFGARVDPITGQSAFHPGVDFAAAAGTPVMSVASGVVTWAGYHPSYGFLVEINHGNGYSTRYGHNERIMVHTGEAVQKGQQLALSGSTGRSTGPHVHFEVLRDGNVVNPYAFIRGPLHPALIASR